MTARFHRLLRIAGAAIVVAGCGSSHDDATPHGPGVGGPEPGDVVTGTAVPDGAGLPPLPQLAGVVGTLRGNSATIVFEPFAGAKYYRLYVLAAKSDVRLASDGSFDGVENAMYRCAGQRAAPGVFVDGKGEGSGEKALPDWVSVGTRVDGQQVNGYTRHLADATLGWAFATPVEGTIAIHAVGDPATTADNYAYGIREPQTRAKLYVADETALVAKAWRDDGVVFYAPSSATSTACGGAAPVAVHTIDAAEKNGASHLFYVAPDEVAARGAGTTPFFLCPTQLPGAQPVMRVNYRISSPGGTFGGESGHDELALGEQRFERARCQASTAGPCADGDRANWDMHWSNITAETTLVVEALDGICPFQGLHAAESMAAQLVGEGDDNGDKTLKNDPFFTLAELHAAAPHGEVFLNGQGDAKSTPHPIARSVVVVKPQAREPMDFSSDFAGKPESFTEVTNADGSPNCGLTDELRKLANNPDTCDGTHRMTSPTYDALFSAVNDKRYSAGPVEGELAVAYSGGKWRMTPKNAKATLSESSFLHVAMEVSAFSTGRRYPQIIISQQDMLTAHYLLDRTPADTTNANIAPVLLFHPIDSGVGRHVLELELCSQRAWQVNNHCPWFLLENADPPSPKGLGPHDGHPDLFDRLQDDRSTRFDLYVSTARAYAFVDSRPYGCVDFTQRKAILPNGSPMSPSPAPPSAGPVTVTFGDVLYHSGAESGYFDLYSDFHLQHMIYETARHYDYLGFKSNVPQPAWNEAAFPCITQMYSGGDAGTQTAEQAN